MSIQRAEFPDDFSQWNSESAMSPHNRWFGMSRIIYAAFYSALLGYAGAGSAANPVHHEMILSLDPAQSELEVTTRITMPEPSKAGQEIRFLLHADLQVQSSQVSIQKQKDADPQLQKLRETSGVPLNLYRVILTDKMTALQLKYKGKIHHALDDSEETPGLISPDGVFLARSTAWYPVFSDNELVTFDLQIRLPAGWGAVSQGELRKDKPEGQHRLLQWVEDYPQDDIYVVASRYHEYRQAIGGISAMVWLRSKDDALAEKYIKATGQYIDLYNNLIGPYPYKKFALVENFWETGFGMPSFTLLGSRVIRFPFIIFSSYPHEILHNYWGNGVFVDYESGNWSEGLTAYLADHLFQEQRGEGAGHRRSVLQKYTDFVNESRDFPLTEFRSRHSPATEAVGYGKTLMLFHMLRRQLGDEKFKTALQAFYQKHRFGFASFTDVERVFSGIAGRDLKAFFRQWVQLAGAPFLSISAVSVKEKDAVYEVSFTLQQQQQGAAYQLEVPVVVYFRDGGHYQTTVAVDSKQHSVSIKVIRKPVIIDVDPEFDVFRRLDSREIPPAISQGFGDDKPLLVLPAGEETQRLNAYRELAEQWKKQQMPELEIVNESEVVELPGDRSVWIMGRRNRFRQAVISGLQNHGVEVTNEGVTLNQQQYYKDKHALLLSVRNPQNPLKTLLWVVSENAKAIPGLARKLPHYGKYSYLVFEGDAPDNIVKGQWDVTDSPMRAVLDKEGAKTVIRAAPRPALVPASH